MKLSIVIVSYNVQYFLKQCLISVKDASKDIAAEIIVVDNNSSDGTCDLLRQNFPDVILIANQKNTGFSKANNQGVEKAKGEYVLILNPDTLIAEDTFDKILAFAEEQKDLGALGVKFVDGTGNFLAESKRNIPSLRVANQKIRGNSKYYYANHIGENETSKVEILTGAFMLLRRKIYDDIGGFDEDYFMYGEDVDLCYRLLNKNYQNYYLGSTTMVHYKGESTVKDISYLRYFYGAMQIFYKKHFKSNAFQSVISTLMIKYLIWFRSLSVSKNKREENPAKNFLLISDDQILFEKLQNKLGAQKISISRSVPEQIAALDMVIFDQTFVSTKEIINNFQNAKLKNIPKRIIPKRSNYFIGSDSSAKRGEVVKF